MKRLTALALIMAMLTAFPLTCNASEDAVAQTDTAEQTEESEQTEEPLETESDDDSAQTDDTSEQADQTEETSDPYDVVTLLATAQFASKPRIYTYNYALSDYICKLAEYCYTADESECVLITLTFPDELSEALADFSDEDMASLLRMTMDALESMGFLLDAGEASTLYDMQYRDFIAYTDTTEYAGWAVMDSRQVQFVLATIDDAGYDFLKTVKTRRSIEFTKDGSNVSYDDVTLVFPYSVDVSENTALSTNSLTTERAELIQLSDYTVINGITDSDDQTELLSQYVPEGAADVSTQTVGSRATMLYSYDDEDLGKPIQGRLILMDDCILRMEATFDNAGDAFMDGVYVTTD